MDVQKYLQRIGLSTIENVDVKTLQQLQQQHLLHIPFENLDIHLGKPILLDYENIFKKVILQNRGGFCYELNGLFYLLLEQVGYSVKRVSARVLGSSGNLGPEFDHLAVIVRLGAEDWLVDVGFGKFSFIPLKIELDLIQHDGTDQHKVLQYDEHHLGVYTFNEKEEWQLGYIFTLQARAVSEFEQMCHYQQTSPETNFTKRRLITIPNKNGRITLMDTKLKITDHGKSIETPVTSEEEFQNYLKKYFGMEYEY